MPLDPLTPLADQLIAEIPNGGLFIAGTDTGVGKTYFATALVRALRSRGGSAVGYKPVAAGCEETPHGLRNDDALALLAASAWDAEHDYARINPVALTQPLSPHIAAARDGREITIAELLRGYQDLVTDDSLVVVEGAGGWLTPISAHEGMNDLAIALDLPVLLVVGLRLGCLNHALLSAAAIVSSGLPFLGWVANHLDPNMAAVAENLATLQARLPGAMLAELPFAE